MWRLFIRYFVFRCWSVSLCEIGIICILIPKVLYRKVTWREEILDARQSNYLTMLLLIKAHFLHVWSAYQAAQKNLPKLEASLVL